MALSPLSFASFASSDTNAPEAASLYQSFLLGGTVGAPFGVKQIGPFEFDMEGDDSFDGENEITDHWVEDNTTVEDHIGVKPARVTLKGSVSDLVFSAQTAGIITSALASVENRLSQVDAYLGAYTPGVSQRLIATITQAQNIAVQIQQGAARVSQIAAFFGPKPGYNKQQTAFALLNSLRQARIIFTVFTPFQVFFNMAIESVHVTQPAWTRNQSDFTIRMKQLQFTDDISQSSFFTQYGGRAANGYQPQTANGVTSGVQVTASDIRSAF